MKILKTIKLMLSMAVVVMFIGCGGVGSDSQIQVNAGKDLTIKLGESITLHAESTKNGSFMWVEGNSMEDGQRILSFTSTLNFTATKVGVFTYTVQVKDADGFAQDSVTITVIDANTENKPPISNAGVDKSIIVNETITLVGRGIDSDGTIVDYKWKKDSNILATTAQFDYTPTIIGTDILTLTVTDDDGAMATDKVSIIVKELKEDNKAPIANAGEDKSVIINQSITITGTGIDSDGTISTYEWKKDDVVIATTAQFEYTPTTVGTDILTLTVIDNDGLKSSSDSMVVTVKKEVTHVVNGKIDLANYYPNRNMTKNYIEKWKFKDEEEGKTATEKEKITVKDNIISMITTYSDDEDIDIEMTTINQNTITYKWDNGKYSSVSNRYVNIGDITRDITFEDINSYSRCTLVDKLTTFSHGGYEYSGDIIKEKCITSYGNSFEYRKKDLGLIASIDESKTYVYDYFNSYYITEKDTQNTNIPTAIPSNTEEEPTDKNEIFVDSRTGLQWQDNQDAGVYGDEPSKNWDDAKNYCSNLSLGNYNDWYLPSIDELKTITSKNSLFDNVSYGFYWSSTTDNSSSYYNALGIYFANSGSEYSFNKEDEYQVRCVRGGSNKEPITEEPQSGFSRKYEMVTDHSTGLQWQDSTFNGLLAFKNWDEAVEYCNSLTLGGYNDWYLPKLEELETIVDKSRPTNYAMLNEIFENTFPTDYWTSTSDTSSPEYNAWSVTFNSYSDGNSIEDKDYSLSVRCVRK